jgi:hypothetical protein
MQKLTLYLARPSFCFLLRGCGLADACYSGSGLGRALEVEVMTGLTRNQEFSFSQVTEATNA